MKTRTAALVGMLVLASAVALIGVAARAQHRRTHTVYIMRGIEWVDDTCYVDDAGRVWCGPMT